MWIAIGLVVLIAAALVWLYTRAMPVSAATPTSESAEFSEELFACKKLLFVGAHPDDIEFYAGGLVHKLLQGDAEVLYAIATRGGKGRTGRAKDRLEGLRTQHQLDAAQIVGGARVVFYDYPDKGLPARVNELVKDIRDLIASEEPDIVLSWDPDHIRNPHPDHVAAAQAVDIAALDADVPRCFYGTRQPNLWVEYGEEVFQVKLKSLRAHRTETWWPYFLLGRRFLTKISVDEGRKTGAKYAEVFRYVR